MNKYQHDVEEFHRACDLPVGGYIQHLTPERTELRRKLIKEEAKEMRDGLKKGSIVEIIDGACDTIVVVLGTLVEMGIDLDPFWDEVHRTNMAKAHGPVREDGKKLKPPGWVPPDLKGILLGAARSEAHPDPTNHRRKGDGMTEDEAREEMARMRAAMDQAKEASREMAAAMWTFYKSCVDEGFEGWQAMVLTTEFMKTLLGGAKDE